MYGMNDVDNSILGLAENYFCCHGWATGLKEIHVSSYSASACDANARMTEVP